MGKRLFVQKNNTYNTRTSKITLQDSKMFIYRVFGVSHLIYYEDEKDKMLLIHFILLSISYLLPILGFEDIIYAK